MYMSWLDIQDLMEVEVIESYNKFMTKNNLVVAVAQYDVPMQSGPARDKLLSVAKEARGKGVQLLVAPETAVSDLIDTKNDGTDYLPVVREIAKEVGLAIATSMYRKEQTGYFNHGYIVGPKGEIWHDHRKIYPAPPEIEDGVVSGDSLTTTDTPLGKLGMIICKDAFTRYSHYLYEKLASDGVEITCVPTWSLGWSKTETGKYSREYIRAFLEYGAFYTRSFFLVSGTLNKQFGSYGRAMIISPIRGILRLGSTDKEELLIKEINLSGVTDAREWDSKWQPKERII